jgi:hypothetical protein
MRRSAAALAALLLGSATPVAAEEIVLRANRPGRPAMDLRAEARDGAWRIRVLDASGAEQQLIEVASDAVETPPRIVDVDGDNAGDLWVPVMSGNANTEYEIWRSVPREARFQLSGTISGVGFRRDGGYLVAIARNGCCASSYAFYRFRTDGRMVPAFSIAVQHREDGTVEECQATAESDQAPEQLRRRWCAAGVDDLRPGLRL